MHADCTLFVYGLLTLVIVLNTESRMFQHSRFGASSNVLLSVSLALAVTLELREYLLFLFLLSSMGPFREVSYSDVIANRPFVV